jgi:phenol 2-monooxygenase
VDVLIIGAGPAGYMAATWLARTGVNARIIDKRSSRVFAGQADGLQCRTLEVMQSFGFCDRALKEGNHMLEICFWEPDAKGNIYRTESIPDTIPGISRFQQIVVHQGRIEQWFSDAIKKWSHGKMEVDRPVLPLALELDESVKSDDFDAHPVQVTVRHMADEAAMAEQYGSKVANGLFRAFEGDSNKDKFEGDEGKEIIHAKYVIGCDGAHSWTRRQIGIEMEGESTDYIWGVLDAVPITDFPDIRNRCAIHSANNGSVMIIPREQGLVRLYIQMKEAPREAGSARVDRAKITPDLILDSARKIFHPYKLDMVDMKWYTAYQIGQRVAGKFQKNERVFIAGDACHTHSPKAGQGMNTSLMDTYNLCWKIAHVCKGLAKASILSTYESERTKVAKDLIAFDYKLSRLFCGKPGKPGDKDGVSLEEFHRYFEKGNEFASGTTVDYQRSLLQARPSLDFKDGDEPPCYYAKVAKNVAIGRRFDSARVINQADARSWYINDRMLSDGRWRVLYFAGDVKANTALYDFMKKFGEYLASNDTFVKRYTPATAQIDSVLQLYLIHASARRSLEWDEFPEAFRHRDHVGRMDYWSIYADDMSYHEGHGRAYEKYGVDPNVGALIVVRPDNYVSMVTELSGDGIEDVTNFFNGLMAPQKESWTSNGGFKDVAKREEDTYGKHDFGNPVLAV